MATQYGKLVNKQFNSPINLYSENNIREVLDRESQMLSNGAVGINFHNPMSNKPGNLQNSAVLRFLEEEESQKRGGSPNLKRVAWPPPPEAEGHLEELPIQNIGTPQITSPGLPNNQVPSANYQQTSPIQQGIQSNYQQRPDPSNYYHPQVQYKPLQVAPPSPVNQPCSPKTNVNPSHYTPMHGPKGWAPVHSPVFTKSQPHFPTSPQQDYYHQPSVQEYQHPIDQQNYYSPQYQYSPYQQFEATVPVQQQQQPHHYQQQRAATLPRYQQNTFVEPPPSTITLRPQAPVSQASAPVYTSQPATATLQGGKNLRGDLKWPPPETKAQMEEDNRKRIELARGPVCRPRKVNRDYTGFFAQHALNDTYPRYKTPPGTQFYVRE
ncbi:hypothetical protein RN001_005196 [Aquatica leii]|uniref:Zasp-like motif domain-containing protein n=1 Tax=Aquatica leii TaxID=1421715 RepID=A0AAN7PBL9_9COLE|nr:hypothetical protein RN001_005196 [Aquatica leii]